MPTPHKRTRRALGGLVAAAVALSASVLASPSASSVGPDPAPKNYVALGDSFSAGAMLKPTDPNAWWFCMRSMRNYPHLIAEQLNIPVTDVTCSGAMTGHFTKAQDRKQPAQLNAVTADTDLITMTIGGNDGLTFLGATVACAYTGIAAGGKGTPCQSTFGKLFDNNIDNIVYPNLVRTLKTVRAKAPKAQIAILGYPQLLPEAPVKCAVAVAPGDFPYLYNLQVHLNKVIQRAADETGVVFVDMSEISAGHDSCQPSGTRWTEPLFMFTAAPGHPNADGMAAMATHTIKTLGLGKLPEPDPTDGPTPTVDPTPTDKPEPTQKPDPTEKPDPQPTDKPEPTQKPDPTEKPDPQPTDKPEPVPTTAPPTDGPKPLT